MKRDNHTLRMSAKVSREARLQREFFIGKPRAKSWGGKPSPKEDRKNWRKSEE